MPLLRSGLIGTFASPQGFWREPSTARHHLFGLLTLFSLSAASSVSAKPAKTAGVQAWTSGSQTFIRARPGATVPPVAKVARHTPLYVWGKYNGWYRVETHDHIFGWVYNDYLNAPGLEKIHDMPHARARVASDRTANQVMYGSPELLKKHFAIYKAPGAAKGLQKQGVYVAIAPKPSPKPKVILAKASHPAVKAAPRIASAPRVREKFTAPVIVAPVASPPAAPAAVQASPVPVVEPPNTLSPVENVAPLTPATPVGQSPRASVPAANGSNDETPDSQPRSVESAKIAGASNNLAPSARLFARMAGEMASKPATTEEAPATTPESAPVVVAPKPVVVAPTIPAVPVKPRVAPKPKLIAKKPTAKKPVAKAPVKSRYASRRDRSRQQLRATMGLSPASVPPTVIAPVSPAELLKARDEYLNARKARLNSPVDSQTPGAPVVGLAPLPAASGPLGGPPAGSIAPVPPAAVAPSAFNGATDELMAPLVLNDKGHPLQPILDNPYIIALSQMKPKAPVLIAMAPTKAAPLSARGGSPRGGSPLNRAPLNRSGSPRDRMASGVAMQALSYRGMPYIRGAASPNRGFDCSGLVYYLLRQRGYNPPRTAAGYKNWGASVPRGQWKPGDLVLFANTYKRGISHIGVYLGNGKFVHAATSGTGVRVSSLSEAYYSGKYYGARRIK